MLWDFFAPVRDLLAPKCPVSEDATVCPNINIMRARTTARVMVVGIKVNEIQRSARVHRVVIDMVINVMKAIAIEVEIKVHGRKPIGRIVNARATIMRCLPGATRLRRMALQSANLVFSNLVSCV